MAEANKSGILAKAQKRISRTKTKVLQTLGKAEKYSDESFDDLVQKTEKQHDEAHHVQKEIKSYLSCVRALSNASKSLSAALSHAYEEDWTNEIECKKLLEAQDLLWTDYLDSVQTTVMEPMNNYLAGFPPLKLRTAKRGRKMVDFDNTRHNLEVLQSSKKKDEAKITKAQEELNESRQIFEELHSELCTELPSCYNSRITFYADMFQKLFTCENRLHTELARVSQGLTETADKLSKDHVQFVYTPKRPLSKSLSEKNFLPEESSSSSDEQPLNGDSSPRPGTDSPASSASPAATPTTPTAKPRTSTAPLAASGGAVGGGAAAAAAVAEDGEQRDEEDSEHLYGNQEAVMAATKVNGDIESEQKSEPPAEDTTTSTSTPGNAVAEEGSHSDPSAPSKDCDTVRGTASAQLPTVASSSVEEWDDNMVSLYLTPVPSTFVTPTLPPSASLSLAVPAVHVPQSVALPTEKRGLQQVSGTGTELMTKQAPAQSPGEERSVGPSVEKDVEERQRKESSPDMDEFTELRKISSGDCRAFIDTSFQQEMDTALKEESEARSPQASMVQISPALTKSDASTVKMRMAPSGEMSPAPDTKAEVEMTDISAEPPGSSSVTEVEREACSEVSSIPTSISDFETLAETSEKKAQTDSEATKDPDQKEVAGSPPDQNCCESRSAAEQKEGGPGLPQNRSEVTPSMMAACPAISMASSEFLITSSFSDVSSCQNFHSPLGEVYENITFSSQEDLADHDAHVIGDGADRAKHPQETEGAEEQAEGSISAEEKNVISALEQAIRSASSPGLPDASLGDSHMQVPSALYSFHTAGHLTGQESVSEDEGLYENVMEMDWRMGQAWKDSLPQHQLNTHAERFQSGAPHESQTEYQGNVTRTDLAESSEQDRNPLKDSIDANTGVHPGHLCRPPTPPRDPVTGVMLKPPVFLIAPYTQRSREKDREKSSPKSETRMGEESKKSFSHKGFDMVRSMLHLSSKTRNTGQKSETQPAKSADFGSPEHASSGPEDARKQKRLSTEKFSATDSKSMRREVSAAYSSLCDDSKETPENSPEEFSQKGNDKDPRRCRPVNESFSHQDTSSSPKGFRPGPATGNIRTEETQLYTCTKVSGGSSPSGRGDGGNTGSQKGDSQQVPYSVLWASGSPGLIHDSQTSALKLTGPEVKSGPETETHQKSSALGSSVTAGGSSTGFKSSGQSLNPLAPPFMMPTSTTGPKLGSGSVANPNFSSPSSVTMPAASEVHSHGSSMSALQAVLPHTKVDGQAASFYADSQQSLLGRAYSVQPTKPTAEPRKEDPSFLPSHLQTSRNSSFMSALQDAFHGRRFQNSQQPGLHKKFPKASFLQQGWRPSEPSPLSYSPIHSRLQLSQEGWGHGNGGDVAVRTAPSLPVPMQKSLVKGEVARSGLAHPATGMNLSPSLCKMSKLGEGDMVRQLPISPLAKEAMVTAAEPSEVQRPSPVQSTGQKVSMRTPSPQVTSNGKAAEASFDLDMAREAWRKAWRASSIPDNTTQARPGNESKDNSVQASVPQIPKQVSTSDTAKSLKGSGLGASGAETKEVSVYENIPCPLPRTVFGSIVKDCKSESEKEGYITKQGKSSNSSSSERTGLKKASGYENVEKAQKSSSFPNPDHSPSTGIFEGKPETGQFKDAQDASVLEKPCPIEEHLTLTSSEVVENCSPEDLGPKERLSHQLCNVGSQKPFVEEGGSQVSEINVDGVEDSVLPIGHKNILSSLLQKIEDTADGMECEDKNALSMESGDEPCVSVEGQETGECKSFENSDQTQHTAECVNRISEPVQGSCQIDLQTSEAVSSSLVDGGVKKIPSNGAELENTEGELETLSKNTELSITTADVRDSESVKPVHSSCTTETTGMENHGNESTEKLANVETADTGVPIVENAEEQFNNVHTCEDFKELSVGAFKVQNTEDFTNCLQVNSGEEQSGTVIPTSTLNTMENSVSDRFEAPRDRREVSQHQGLDMWEVKTNPAVSAGNITDLDEPGRPSSCESGLSSEQRSSKEIRETRTRRTHSLASLMESRASELDRSGERSLGPGLLPSHLERTSRGQRYGDEEAAAPVDQNQVSLSHSHSGRRVNSARESISVDVTYCDSGISAMWEAGEYSRNDSVDADTSSELVLACDSGISTTEVVHSSSELRNYEDRPSDVTDAELAEYDVMPSQDQSHAVPTAYDLVLQQEQADIPSHFNTSSHLQEQMNDTASGDCAGIGVEYSPQYSQNNLHGATECRGVKNAATGNDNMQESNQQGDQMRSDAGGAMYPEDSEHTSSAETSESLSLDLNKTCHINQENRQKMLPEPGKDRKQVGPNENNNTETVRPQPEYEDKPSDSHRDSPVEPRKCTELENCVTVVGEAGENWFARGDEKGQAEQEQNIGTAVCEENNSPTFIKDSFAAHTVHEESATASLIGENETVLNLSPSETSSELQNKLPLSGQTRQTQAIQTEDIACDITEEFIVLPACGITPTISQFAKKSNPERERSIEPPQGDSVTNQTAENSPRDTSDVVTQTDSLDKSENSAVDDSKLCVAADPIQHSGENITSVNLNTAPEENLCQKVELIQKTTEQEKITEREYNTEEKDRVLYSEGCRDQMDTGVPLAERNRVDSVGEDCLTSNESNNDTNCGIVENRSATEYFFSHRMSDLEDETTQNNISAERQEAASFHDCMAETTRELDDNDYSQNSREEPEQGDGEMTSTEWNQMFQNENVSKTTEENLVGNEKDKTALTEQKLAENLQLSTAEREGHGSKHSLDKTAEEESGSKLDLHATGKKMIHAHQDDSTHREDSTHMGDSIPKKDSTQKCDSPHKESDFEGEGSEGFEVTGVDEADLEDTTDEVWEVTETGQGCDHLGPLQCQTSKAQSAYSTQNGPELPAISEGGNVYEVPHKGDDEDSDDDDDDGAVYHSPPSNKPVCEPPPTTLYQVEATHAYSGEDIDELSFDPGDIIYVVPFENEDEQDVGWQLGIKQRDGLKGVFPENFTRRL